MTISKLGKMRIWDKLSAILMLAVMAGCGGGYSGGGGGGNPAPPTPAGLAATAGDAQVALTWSASIYATSYRVKRSTTTGGPYTQISTPTTTAFTDTGLTNGTKYFYVVSAYDAAGESANSSEVSATPKATSAPAAPTGLTATPGNAQVALNWTASTGATSYNVKRSLASGGPYTTLGSPAVTTSTDTTVTNGTKYFYVVTAVNAVGESGNSLEMNATPSNSVAVNVTVTLDPSTTKAISPYIYGINSYSGVPSPPTGMTLDRDGGNRWTAYNWETNASNAGNDYFYHNDNFLSSSAVPAEAVRTFIAGDQTNGLASLVTVQLQGLVSADENGAVSVANPPDLTRFKTVVDQKSSVSAVPFTTSPPTNNANVYMDEFVWALDQKLPGIFGASPAHPTFVSLDNEPELWNSTHLEVQGHNPVTSDNYITKTITLSKALKDQFPKLVIFGPVHYGFQGIYNWQNDPTITATPNGADWFPDKYLTQISAASTTYGKPLVDVYDFHWYPEEYDASALRITSMNGTTLTAAQIQLIVQSPRNLWDATFNDAANGNSNPWVYQELGGTIGNINGGAINILGRLQAKINAEFPSMKLSITEYECGGWNHIAGTVAQADTLGVFGNEGVFASNLWPPGGTYDYALAGFRAFRDFDGAGANFGDISVKSTSSDVSSVMLYASQDTTAAGRVVFVAINRTNTPQTTAINGLPLSGTAHIYQMTSASANNQTPVVKPISKGTLAVSGSSMTITLPALSVTTVDVH